MDLGAAAGPTSRSPALRADRQVARPKVAVTPTARPHARRAVVRRRLAAAGVVALSLALVGGPTTAAVAQGAGGADGVGRVERVAVDGDVRTTTPASESGATRAERQRQRRQARAEAEQMRQDRLVALASSWQPDPTLLTPQEGDSPQTAVARERLATIVARMEEASAAYDVARRRSDRAAATLKVVQRRLDAASAAAEAAQRQFARDRAALSALAADTYRNGSAGQLSAILGADDDDALFSGLTLLRQMSSSQDDAVRRMRAATRELLATRKALEEAETEAGRVAKKASSSLRAATTLRAAVLRDVERLQDLARESILRDEVVRRQQQRRDALAEALAQRRDRDLLMLSGLRSGLSEADATGLTRVSARLAEASPGGVVFPLPGGVAWRDNDNWGNAGGLWAADHTGDDFSVACATPVLAATRGTVQVRSDQRWAGPQLVMVDSPDGGASTWYAHMEEVTVRNGQTVRAGQRIGSVGSLGNSTGCHLHFEVHPLGGSIYEDNVDPVAWLLLTGAYPA